MFDSIGRRLVLGTVLIALVAVAAPSAGALDQTCATAGTTITADSVARAYQLTPTDQARVYACLYGKTPLQIAQSDVTVNPIFEVALSGRYVAVATDERQPFFALATLRVFDLGTGRMISQPRPATTGNLTEITAVVLSGKPVAWIASRRNLHRGQVSRRIYEVHRVEARGATLLDTGPNIAPASLALSGNGQRIYWLNGRSLRTAAL